MAGRPAGGRRPGAAGPGQPRHGQLRERPQAAPTISPPYIKQWTSRVGPDRFSHAADGHRLLGLHSQLWSSGLAEEVAQLDWLQGEIDAAATAGETVHVLQHAPLFLNAPDEVRGDRGTYWCPEATARDRVLAVLDRPHVQTLASGHVHRRRDQPMAGGLTRVWWCPALSGTHSDADYFPVNPGADTHGLAELDPQRGRHAR